jgi:hypothetical protein
MLDKKELNWQDKQKLENVMQRQNNCSSEIEKSTEQLREASNSSRSSVRGRAPPGEAEAGAGALRERAERGDEGALPEGAGADGEAEQGGAPGADARR